MEIGSNSPKLPSLESLLRQAASPEAQKLAKELGVSIGRNIPALVVSLASISEAQREAILRPSLSATLASPNMTNKVNDLLNSPDLKMVKLSIKQKLVNTVSALPIREGENIQVRIHPSGQLQLAKALPASPSAQTPRPADITRDASLKTKGKPVERAPNAPSSTTSTSTIATTKSAAPEKTTTSNLAGATTLTGTDKPNTNTQGPTPVAKHGTSQPTQNTIATTTTTPPLNHPLPAKSKVPIAQYQNSLSRPPQHVPQAHRASGTQTPNNQTQARSNPQALKLTPTQQSLLTVAIRNALPNAEPPTQLFKQLDSLIPALRQSNVEQIQSSLLAKDILTSVKLLQNMVNINSQQTDIEGLANKIQQTVKNSGIFMEQKLLSAGPAAIEDLELDSKSLLSQVQNSLQQTLSALQNNPTSKIFNNLDQALLQLFSGKLGYQPESTPNEARRLSEQYLNAVQKSLLNIQYNQYKSIDRVNLEQAPLQNHFQVDIPLRFPEGFFNVFFQLREKKITEEENESPSKKKQRCRSRWSVFLELEMGDEGPMAVEMNLCEQDIDLQFWAEKPSLREKTQAELQQLKTSLEAQGLRVEDLRCSAAPPPKRELSFNRSLIDIKT